jgi:hypothetical protein
MKLQQLPDTRACERSRRQTKAADQERLARTRKKLLNSMGFVEWLPGPPTNLIEIIHRIDYSLVLPNRLPKGSRRLKMATSADEIFPVNPFAIVRDYAGLHKAIRERAAHLGYTNEILDAVAGLQSGYAGKLLGPGMARKFGPMSLGAVIGALGLCIVIIEDGEAPARYRTPVDERKRPRCGHVTDAGARARRQRDTERR